MKPKTLISVTMPRQTRLKFARSVASGMTAVADPGLTAGPNGFTVLSPGSPAIDRATTDLPVVYDVPGIDDAGLTVDVEGQARPADPAARDVGADERAATAVTNRPLEQRPMTGACRPMPRAWT